MSMELQGLGAADPEVVQLAHEVWLAAAQRSGIDVTGLDAVAPLDQRLAWARARGLEIACVLSRYSTKMQQSTTAQVRECVQYAAAHGMYVPPEYVCVDEGESGKKERRSGLQRLRQILAGRLACTLLVYKVSRLFRAAYKGFRFLQEEVVEEGLRAVSITQGIDTADESRWKPLLMMHGMLDEQLLEAIADHARSGLSDLFQRGYVTGALTVGYLPREVAGTTNRGRPRTMPEVAPKVAKLIRWHFRRIAEGMTVSRGWRLWSRAGGPADPRSRTGRMSYTAYRRLLSNPRYIGRWAFGRTRNVWSSKRDYTRQIEQPEAEVRIVQSEDLRIVDDETFFAVQGRLAKLRQGPRGPRRQRDVRLWDLVTDCFHCAHCSADGPLVRFYQAGANGKGMRCKHGKLCPALSVVQREASVRAVCRALAERLVADVDLVAETVATAGRIDLAHDEDELRGDLDDVESRIRQSMRRIDDLRQLAGIGTDEDRTETMRLVATAQEDRNLLQLERARLQRELSDRTPITHDRVREILGDLVRLLEDAAAGALGEEAVHRAAHVFELLVGGRILVHVERRADRAQKNVRATFVPELLRTTRDLLNRPPGRDTEPSTEVSVWLREPPRTDRLAERVHQLVDVEGVAPPDVGELLVREGAIGNPKVVYQLRQRYFQMIGAPMPPLAYNNGRRRRSR